MIKVELELAKCRERTSDEAVVLLMMEAKVDVLREISHTLWNSKLLNADLDRDWCQTQRLRLRGAA